MRKDPFDLWYEGQLSKDEDAYVRLEEFNFYTISHDSGDHGDIKENVTTVEKLDHWAQNSSPPEKPGIDLIICQHKFCDIKDVLYQWMPLQAPHLTSIFEELHLSKHYLHLRGTGGAHSGAFTSYIDRDLHGNISEIRFVIRVGHGSSVRFSSMWAMALTWNAQTGRTVGFLEGFSVASLGEFKMLVAACSDLLSHPLTLPEIFVHMITTHLNERIRVPCEESFYKEEMRAGLSNLSYPKTTQPVAIRTWSWDDFQNVTAKANRYITTMLYLKRRFRSTADMTRRLLGILDEMSGSMDYKDNSTRQQISIEVNRTRQRLFNRIGLLENYAHQTDCVLTRIENLKNVLYTVLAQIDSKTQQHLGKINLQIAQAVRSDSLPMRTIAYITLVLLPGAFIAAIFGMNFFQFDEEKRDLIVARSFWQYWAVTIPVTILVLLVWNIWNFREKRKGTSVSKTMQHLSQ